MKTQTDKMTPTPTLSSSAIYSSSEDRFNYSGRVAETVKKALALNGQKISYFKNQSFYTEASVNIAVTGGWGIGKSSFLNLMKENISNNKRGIIFSFNP